MYKICVIFIALFAISHSFPTEFPGGPFKSSVDRHDYYESKASSNESTPFSGRFKFKVKASSNASIAFSTRGDKSDVEFLIGVTRNLETIIRINETNVVVMQTPNILSANEYKTFEITWLKSVFHFAEIDEKNNDDKNLMLYKNSVVFPINYIGLKIENGGLWFIRKKPSPRIFDAYIKTMNETVLQIGNSLRCMVLETKSESRPIYVHTQSSPIQNRNYTYVQVPENNCYNIYVRAKFDAHIELTYNKSLSTSFEFHLRPQGIFNITVDFNSNEIGNKFVPYLLSQEEYRGYWIEIEKSTGKLFIGKMGENPFMSLDVDAKFIINYIGVLTSNGNVGDWLIHKHGSCPGIKYKDINQNQNEFWGDAKTRCYIENMI